jgi:hypothetical protein
MVSCAEWEPEFADDHLAQPLTAGQVLSVKQAFIADAPVDGPPPSDHYAVIADLAL